MKDYEVWLMITRHLAEDETEQEKEVFLLWLRQNTNNQIYFERVKKVWDAEADDETNTSSPPKLTFREKLTLPNIIDFITKKALGNIIGIAVGLQVAKTFTHSVTERRSLNNLFGLSHRETIIVNDIPYWLQATISVTIGYIALEIMHYFLQTKQFIALWNLSRKKLTPYFNRLNQRY